VIGKIRLESHVSDNFTKDSDLEIFAVISLSQKYAMMKEAKSKRSSIAI